MHFLEMIFIGDRMDNLEGKKISAGLAENLTLFGDIFKKDKILRIREFTGGKENPIPCAVLFIDGMVNSQILNESIVRPVLLCDGKTGDLSPADYIIKRVLFAAEAAKKSCVSDILRGLLYGDSVLLLDNCTEALVINTKGWRTRGISEPNDERVLQGPREGFDESVMLNLAMIRRRLPTPDLCVETATVGRRTDTFVFICYLDSLVNKRVLKELKKRLEKIDIDGILDSNYISELITSAPFSPLKTIGSTERPDIVAARLLEGRVAVMVDGTPVVLTLPYLFSENFQSDDDYYLNFIVAGMGRILRYICFFLSISVPALYLALITTHRSLLPTALAISISSARNGVPFPSIIECISLIGIFEILRETGIRMPQSVGHALSIVGGLVVGQAAVEAKIVSAPMLIIVALSGIAGLMLPRLKGIVSYGRIILVLLAHIWGLFGYLTGIAALLILIFSLNSFGVDYTSSLSSISPQSIKDTLVRAPWRNMKTRPQGISNNRTRKV